MYQTPSLFFFWRSGVRFNGFFCIPQSLPVDSLTPGNATVRGGTPKLGNAALESAIFRPGARKILALLAPGARPAFRNNQLR